jgi:hypothetical protein
MMLHMVSAMCYMHLWLNIRVIDIVIHNKFF